MSINKPDWGIICYNYFDSHARQRFSFINFYIIITTTLLYSISFLKNPTYSSYIVIIVAHIFEIILTYIFYKLDKRSSFLVKNAERVLKNIEMCIFTNNASRNEFSLYSHEESETLSQISKRCCYILQPITYSECFNILFGVIAIYSSTIIVFVFFKIL